MKNIAFGVFAACVLFVFSATARAQSLINEISVNPPGSDVPCEYLELRGTPNTPLTNLYFISVNGDIDLNPGPGFVNLSITFENGANTPFFGANGLLAIVGAQQCGTRTYPAETAVYPVLVGPGGAEAFPNGTNSFLLISSPTPLANSVDYDADNNGTLEGLPAGATIIDSVSWSDGGAGDITYGTRLTATGGTIGAATRFPDNTTANSAAAWYGGALDGATNSSVTYSATIRTANFPSNGVLTPAAVNLGTAATTQKAPFDFDGDQKTDIGVFRPTPGEWWIQKSSGGVLAATFGSPTDTPVPADYTGDGKTDIAFFRPSNVTWYVLRSENFSFYGFEFGLATDVLAPADYDGDGKADPAVFRDGAWYVLRSSDGGTTIASFGIAGDKPVPADYDGDGKADIAVYRPNGGTGGEWWIQKSSGGVFAATFGTATDKTTAGDWTGDGKADCAFFRPSNNTWYVLRSEDLSFFGFEFGIPTDTPAPGDYDGDGKFDAAVFRQPGAQWYVNKSSGGVTSQSFGTAGDQPIPGTYVR